MDVKMTPPGCQVNRHQDGTSSDLPRTQLSLLQRVFGACFQAKVTSDDQPGMTCQVADILGLPSNVVLELDRTKKQVSPAQGTPSTGKATALSSNSLKRKSLANMLTYLVDSASRKPGPRKPSKSCPGSSKHSHALTSHPCFSPTRTGLRFYSVGPQTCCQESGPSGPSLRTAMGDQEGVHVGRTNEQKFKRHLTLGDALQTSSASQAQVEIDGFPSCGSLSSFYSAADLVAMERSTPESRLSCAVGSINLANLPISPYRRSPRRQTLDRMSLVSDRTSSHCVSEAWRSSSGHSQFTLGADRSSGYPMDRMSSSTQQLLNLELQRQSDVLMRFASNLDPVHEHDDMYSTLDGCSDDDFQGILLELSQSGRTQGAVPTAISPFASAIQRNQASFDSMDEELLEVARTPSETYLAYLMSDMTPRQARQASSNALQTADTWKGTGECFSRAASTSTATDSPFARKSSRALMRAHSNSSINYTTSLTEHSYKYSSAPTRQRCSATGSPLQNNSLDPITHIIQSAPPIKVNAYVPSPREGARNVTSGPVMVTPLAACILTSRPSAHRTYPDSPLAMDMMMHVPMQGPVPYTSHSLVLTRRNSMPAASSPSAASMCMCPFDPQHATHRAADAYGQPSSSARSARSSLDMCTTSTMQVPAHTSAPLHGPFSSFPAQLAAISPRSLPPNYNTYFRRASTSSVHRGSPQASF